MSLLLGPAHLMFRQGYFPPFLPLLVTHTPAFLISQTPGRSSPPSHTQRFSQTPLLRLDGAFLSQNLSFLPPSICFHSLEVAPLCVPVPTSATASKGSTSPFPFSSPCLPLDFTSLRSQDGTSHVLHGALYLNRNQDIRDGSRTFFFDDLSDPEPLLDSS